MGRLLRPTPVSVIPPDAILKIVDGVLRVINGRPGVHGDGRALCHRFAFGSRLWVASPRERIRRSKHRINPVAAFRVLVVEDEPMIAMVVDDSIEMLGYTVVAPVAQRQEALFFKTARS